MGSLCKNFFIMLALFMIALMSAESQELDIVNSEIISSADSTKDVDPNEFEQELHEQLMDQNSEELNESPQATLSIDRAPAVIESDNLDSDMYNQNHYAEQNLSNEIYTDVEHNFEENIYEDNGASEYPPTIEN